MTEIQIASIANAIEELHPEPRRRRWASLSTCIVDATWSIGSDYDTVTVPIARRVFRECAESDVDPLVGPSDLTTLDPVPLGEFQSRFPDPSALLEVTNAQLTSTRGGVPKAEAVIRHVAVFVDCGIQSRQDALRLTQDSDELEMVNAALRRIPGEGVFGVRRGYLWMLLGDDNGVKPDRMVLRWLAAQGLQVDPSGAHELLRAASSLLSERSGGRITPWMVDHAVWLAGRGLLGRRRPKRQRESAG